MADTPEDEQVDVDFTDGAVVVSSATLDRIEAMPERIEVDGRRYEVTSYVGPFSGQNGRPVFQASVTPVD